MKRSTVVHFLVLLNACCYFSCNKDVDRKLVGTYKGIARYTIEDVQNPFNNKDTMYTDVLILVSEGTESTRKETRLTLTLIPSTINPIYKENITVDNGEVNFTRTNRGSVGTYYRWKGTIKWDSLKLTNGNEAVNEPIWKWDLKARKQ